MGRLEPHGRRGLLAAALAALLLSGAAAPARAADQTLELEVVINGFRTGRIAEFVLRDGTLLVKPAALSELGVRPPRGAGLTSDGFLALGAVTGLGYRLDQPTQTLFFEAAPSLLAETVLSLAGRAAPPTPPQSSRGVTLDYDLNVQDSGGRSALSSLLDLRAFAPLGVASTTALAYAGAAPFSSPFVRLDTGFDYPDFAADRQLRLGDFITAGLAWTRPVRLGGVQLAHDFSMRPDLVTFPLPGVAGSVAVPSTVQVLLNGQPLVSSALRPGPFQVPSLPVVNGAGVVQMTLTNALGEQVTTRQPFYASAELLASGLQTYAAEAGFVRRSWGVVSNDYGEFAGAATWRRGLTDRVTAEAHAEAASGSGMAGGGVAVNAFNWGVVRLSGAASAGGGQAGGLVSLEAERVGRVFSFALSETVAGPHFHDIAAAEGEPYPRQQLSASAGVALGHAGSVSLAYAEIDAMPGLVRGPTVSAPLAQALERHQRLASASYSVQVRRIAIYAAAFDDFARGGQKGVSIGFTAPLGPRRSASFSAGSGSQPYAQVQSQQSVDRIGDWGYQLFASDNGTASGFAILQKKASWGLVSAGVDQTGRVTTARGELQGGLSLLDGEVFASNPINQAFAVVEDGGIGGVRVLSENREFGRTDSRGRLLVPDLRPFEANRLALDPDDLPADATIDQAEQIVRPADRSGVVVRFPVHRSHGALVVLVDETGAPLPRGSYVTLREGAGQAPVGFDGEAYLEALSPANRLTATLPDGRRCRAEFAYRPAPGEIPKIGPVPCVVAGP